MGALNLHLNLVGGATATLFEVGYFFIFILIIIERLALRKWWFLQKSQSNVIALAILYWMIIAFALLINVSEYNNKSVFIFRLLDSVLFYFVVFDFLTKTKTPQYLVDTIVLSSVIIAVIGIAQYLLGDPTFGTQKSFVGTEYVDKVFYGNVSRIASTTSNPNAFGSTLLLALPLIMLFSWKNKQAASLKVAATVLILIGILLSGSRTAYLVLFALSIFYFISNIKINRIVAAAVIIIIIVNLLAVFEIDRVVLGRGSSILNYRAEVDANKRIYHWDNHLTNINLATMVVGSGIPGITWGGAHNNYIGYLYFGGIPLLLTFLVIAGKMIYLNHKSIITGVGLLNYSLFSYLLFGFTNEVSFQRGPPMIFWAIMALSTYLIHPLHKDLKDNNK